MRNHPMITLLRRWFVKTPPVVLKAAPGASVAEFGQRLLQERTIPICARKPKPWSPAGEWTTKATPLAHALVALHGFGITAV